jgi:hypothetical protein
MLVGEGINNSYKKSPKNQFQQEFVDAQVGVFHL